MRSALDRSACGLAIVASALVVAGCTDAGATTCEEYGAMAFSERGEVLGDLLREHDLEPNDPGNVVGVQSAVDGFCGTGMDAPASSNLSSPLDDAADWNSATW